MEDATREVWMLELVSCTSQWYRINGVYLLKAAQVHFKCFEIVGLLSALIYLKTIWNNSIQEKHILLNEFDGVRNERIYKSPKLVSLNYIRLNRSEGLLIEDLELRVARGLRQAATSQVSNQTTREAYYEIPLKHALTVFENFILDRKLIKCWQNIY
ncbi:unnamed protein product [Enterobius vermicularis]|uniref:F-box protein n=1 Tax=Enterobius vermicularis TaxID=51028 RepID=A0A0N4VG53_ENTVE|nr:unnamed protein product [Enterobius vermicularis]